MVTVIHNYVDDIRSKIKADRSHINGKVYFALGLSIYFLFLTSYVFFINQSLFLLATSALLKILYACVSLAGLYWSFIPYVLVPDTKIVETKEGAYCLKRVNYIKSMRLERHLNCPI
jgi:hypothetical protein